MSPAIHDLFFVVLALFLFFFAVGMVALLSSALKELPDLPARAF